MTPAPTPDARLTHSAAPAAALSSTAARHVSITTAGEPGPATRSAVSAVPAAPSPEALAHFQRAFVFETDCWDVHDAFSAGAPDFVLLDVRSHALFARGHVPGAINLPHGKITAGKLSAYPPQTLFVVYCAGPHCNGAHRGAVRLAALGRPVKLMIGGITGWVDEGFALASATSAE